MKPEPAQPAESPEARAIEAAARAMCDRVNGAGDYDANITQRRTGWVAQAQAGINAYLAATTARPTERGAVEKARIVAADTIGVRGSLRDDYLSGVFDNGDHVRIALAALTPPVMVAATDQAGEGEEATRQVQSSAGMWDKLNERTDPKDAWAAYGEQLRHDAMRLVAALATQPAIAQPPELPMDVRRLVVAARRALDANDWASTGKRDRMRALDKAVEAFSSRVDYDDQPEDAQPATGGTMGGELDPVYERHAGWENDGVVIHESDMKAAREITAKGRIGYGESIRRGEDFVERVEAVALGHALARAALQNGGE